MKRTYKILAIVVVVILIRGLLGSGIELFAEQKTPAGTTFKGFSQDTVIIATYIEKNKNNEKTLKFSEEQEISHTSESSEYLTQFIIDEPTSNKKTVNLSIKNNRVETAINGLASRETVSVSSNKKVLFTVPSDWSGQLNITNTVENSICLAFESKEICHAIHQNMVNS